GESRASGFPARIHIWPPSLGAGRASPRATPSMRGEPPVKSAVETLSPTRAKLTVEVPFEELKPSLDKAYKTIAQQINVPGFRRGKVPAAVIERQFPGAARDQALNDILNDQYVEPLQ